MKKTEPVVQEARLVRLSVWCADRITPVKSITMNKHTLLATLSITAASCMNAPPESGMLPNKSKEQPLEENPMLYAKHIEEPKSLNYTPNILLTGKTGAGKTTLLNKLCGTSKKTGKGASVTRELAYIPVSYGNHAMNIVDTPGIDSDEERAKHAYLLYHAVTTKSYNGILALIKFDDRYHRMVNDYKKIIKPYKDYEKNALILVSNFGENPDGDINFNPRQYRDDIIKKFESRKIYNNVIFYSSRSECDPVDLADAIYGSISRMSPIKMNMSKEDFNFAFDAYMPDEEFSDVQEECDEAMKKIEREFVELAKAYEKDPERDEILQYLYLIIEDELTDKAYKYYEELAPDLGDLQARNFECYLHAQKIKYQESFLKKIKSMMQWRLMGEDDVRNFIKKCPACGEVWMRTEGCDGETDCGNFVKNTGTFGKDTAKSSAWFKFDLIWEKGKLILKKLAEPKAKMARKKKALAYKNEDEKVEKTHGGGKATVERKRRGCGYVFRFGMEGKMMKEEELLQLFEVDSLETLKAYMKSGSKKYKTLVDKYESNIDTTFHS